MCAGLFHMHAAGAHIMAVQARKEAAAMEQKENRRDTAVRLACCAVIALIICYGAEKLGEHLKLPLWEEHGHLLKENKVQAVAILAALFFGASLALFPPAEEDRDSCGSETYTQVECE